MGLPNLIAYERALLHALSTSSEATDAAACGRNDRGTARKHPVVGLVAALDCLGALPFWTTLLDELGFPAMISHPTAEDAAWASRWLAPPSPEVCEPAKTAHVHAANLIRRRSNVVLVPTFERGNHCPVSCGYGAVLADEWERARESGQPVPTLIVPRFHLAKPQAIASHESTPASLRWLVEALRDAAACPSTTVLAMERLVTGAAPEAPSREAPQFTSSGAQSTPEVSNALETLDVAESPDLFEAQCSKALSRALRQQEQFSRIMERETDEVLAWLHAYPARKAVLLAGRPYHLDAFGGTSPDKAAVDAGFAVLSPSGLGASARKAEKRRRDAEPTHSWKQGKHLVRAALVAAADPQIELVCLQSFGCGFDALSIEAARDVLTTAGKSLLVLPMDDASGRATHRVRLRTLAAAHDGRGHAGIPPAAPRKGGDDPRRDRHLPDGLCAIVKHLATVAPDDAKASSGNNDRAPLPQASAPASPSTTRRSSTLETGECALPDLCSACLTEGVPFLLGIGSDIPVSFLDFSSEYERQARSTLTRALREHGPLAPNAPRLGIIGNPLLVADEHLNDGLLAEVVRACVRPVLPQFALLQGEDISYPDQLEAFRRQGIRHVVYLMPQGCLKGHTQVRGALNKWHTRFPELRLTVIDYDPDGSSANRRNRLALALAQARAEGLRA